MLTIAFGTLSDSENGKIRLVYLGSDSVFGFFIQTENGVLTMGPLCVAVGVGGGDHVASAREMKR